MTVFEIYEKIVCAWSLLLHLPDCTFVPAPARNKQQQQQQQQQQSENISHDIYVQQMRYGKKVPWLSACSIQETGCEL
jgi:starvation-inducible outer membrane lipoprotein